MAREVAVRIRLLPFVLDGRLFLPMDARGVVLFSHGSGLRRPGPEQRPLAEALQAAGLGTFALDLLTADEEVAFHPHSRRPRFDADLLAGRLVVATDWLRDRPDTRDLALGYFGAGLGGAAALIAAAERPRPDGALVCTDGRLDRAGPALVNVVTPTLLVVEPGALSELSRRVLSRLGATQKHVEALPGLRRLDRDHGALAQLVALSRRWLVQHLGTTT